MTDTYTQLYIRIIFAVKGGDSLIPKQHKETLHQYITRIITDKAQEVIQINSMPDHLDILVGISPDIAISDLVRAIKADSSKWINEKRWFAGRFEWQAGFGAFHMPILSWRQLSAILEIRRRIIRMRRSGRNILNF